MFLSVHLEFFFAFDQHHQFIGVVDEVVPHPPRRVNPQAARKSASGPTLLNFCFIHCHEYPQSGPFSSLSNVPPSRPCLRNPESLWLFTPDEFRQSKMDQLQLLLYPFVEEPHLLLDPFSPDSTLLLPMSFLRPAVTRIQSFCVSDQAVFEHALKPASLSEETQTHAVRTVDHQIARWLNCASGQVFEFSECHHPFVVSLSNHERTFHT